MGCEWKTARVELSFMHSLRLSAQWFLLSSSCFSVSLFVHCETTFLVIWEIKFSFIKLTFFLSLWEETKEKAKQKKSWERKPREMMNWVEELWIAFCYLKNSPFAWQKKLLLLEFTFILLQSTELTWIDIESDGNKKLGSPFHLVTNLEYLIHSPLTQYPPLLEEHFFFVGLRVKIVFFPSFLRTFYFECFAYYAKGGTLLYYVMGTWWLFAS